MKGNSVFAFFGGLLVGAAAAILFAPESGEETRKKIKNTFDKEYDSLKEKIGNLEARAKAAVDEVKKEVSDTITEETE